MHCFEVFKDLVLLLMLADIVTAATPIADIRGDGRISIGGLGTCIYILYSLDRGGYNFRTPLDQSV